MVLYIAGPLRDASNRAVLETIKETVDHLGLRFWLPHEELGILPTVNDITDNELNILSENITALERCDGIIYLTHPSGEGAALELGYAVAIKKFKNPNFLIVGIDTSRDSTKRADLMAFYCLKANGHYVRSNEELGHLLTSIKNHMETGDK